MLMSSYGVRVSLVVLDGRIWVFSQDGVVSYDPLSDSWRTEASLNINRQLAAVWAHGGKIYVLGGRTWRDFVTKYDTIEMYDPAQGEWQIIGEFVDHRAVADAVVLNEHVKSDIIRP